MFIVNPCTALFHMIAYMHSEGAEMPELNYSARFL